MEWLVIGISGVTCSGKTTLARKLHQDFKNSILFEQDTYFLPIDNPRHVWVKELNHINFDILPSLDMKKMYSDIRRILDEKPLKSVVGASETEKNIFIIEGFLIFDYKPISDLCSLKYFLTLEKEECFRRRELRVYDPPDGPGYFDKVVWPEYVNHKTAIMNNKELASIQFCDASNSQEEVYKTVLNDIKINLKN
ncbi:nicotinamide riboside kinase 1 [Leptopilina heterotoma]|uniref:nicotinamide riboside kinase 1 n=1 Tax=Leptopilina heterotoma TaxID=63436 RepID=UPI001CA9BD09|nr:nicotinamide riboside kinase 1 [Leptopilina heterotoma]